MKYTIVLCFFAAFACSNQVHAGILTDIVDGPVESVKNFVENLISNALVELQTAADSYEKRVNQEIADTEKEAGSIQLEVQTRLKDILNRNGLQMEVINSISVKKQYDLSDCGVMARIIENDTLDLTKQTTSCITNRLETLKARSEPLKEKVKTMHDVLVYHLQANRDCVNNPSSWFIKKAACVADNKLKAIYEVTTRLPGLLAEHAMFLGSELFAPVRGAWCMPQSTFEESVERLTHAVEKVEACVADGIYDATKDKNSKKYVPTENDVDPVETTLPPYQIDARDNQN